MQLTSFCHFQDKGENYNSVVVSVETKFVKIVLWFESSYYPDRNVRLHGRSWCTA